MQSNEMSYYCKRCYNISWAAVGKLSHSQKVVTVRMFNTSLGGL